MFTLDPSDFIIKDIEELSEQESNQLYNKISNSREIEKLYLNKSYKVGNQELTFDDKSLKEIILIYSEALNHMVKCYEFLKGYKKDKFDLENFAKDKASYNLSTDLSRIPKIDKITDGELINLFKKNDSRQLIHITYGSVLRAKDNKGKYIFRDKIYETLFQYEKDHYRELSNHIKRHLELLEK